MRKAKRQPTFWVLPCSPLDIDVHNSLVQFNSIYYTFLTLSTVVLSTVGVLLGMVITGQTFSVIMSGTGVVALAGIVVNNSIVLIDTYQRLLETGMDRVTAILKTAGQRLRPILLTTVTTMIGLFPWRYRLLSM